MRFLQTFHVTLEVWLSTVTSSQRQTGDTLQLCTPDELSERSWVSAGLGAAAAAAAAAAATLLQDVGTAMVDDKLLWDREVAYEF